MGPTFQSVTRYRRAALFFRALWDARLLFRLLILFILVPLIELWLLLFIAERFDACGISGWGATIALVFITGALGAWLARREGLKAIQRIQSDLASGAAPAGAVVDGLLILIAGAFLVTPGVLTDICGFGLLVPRVRRWLRGYLAAAFKKRIVVLHRGDVSSYDAPNGSSTNSRAPIIDVEARVVDSPDPTTDGDMEN